MVRLTGVLVLAALVMAVLTLRQQSRDELLRQRTQLLDQVHRERAGVPPSKDLLSRLHLWLGLSAGKYAGDYIDPSIRGDAAFSAAVESPLIYIRGPIESFTRPSGIAESASSSYRDAFVLCLLDPPASRSEKALLSRARMALAGGRHTSRLAHVSRHMELLVGLPYLLPPWHARVEAAESSLELEKLARDFERAPIQAAKRAAQARWMLSVMDEPNDGSGPTELDGACPHHVRVELREVKSGKALLRLRRHVDPGWISAPVRAEYASGIEGCGLALDIRQQVRGAAVAETAK